MQVCSMALLLECGMTAFETACQSPDAQFDSIWSSCATTGAQGGSGLVEDLAEIIPSANWIVRRLRKALTCEQAHLPAFVCPWKLPCFCA